MPKLKPKFEISNSRRDNIPEISINGIIDRYDAKWIAYQIRERKEERIRININSEGGSVDGAFNIVSAMVSFMASGGIIETVNCGRADSSAGWVFACGTRGERSIMQFGRMFFHQPEYYNADTQTVLRIEDLPEGSQMRTDLENTYSDLVNIFVDATGISRVNMESIMDANTEMTADEAVNSGFADKKIKVNNMPKIRNGITRAQMVNLASSLEIDAVFETDKKVNTKNNNMDEIAKLLGLNPEASAGAILEEVRNIKTTLATAQGKITAQEGEITNLTSQRDKYKSDLESLKDSEVIDYVNKLVALNANLKGSEVSMVNQAKMDFDLFKKMNPVENAKPPKVDDGIEPNGKGGESEEIQNAKKFFGMSAEEKQNLKASNYPEFTKLAEAYDRNSHAIFTK